MAVTITQWFDAHDFFDWQSAGDFGWSVHDWEVTRVIEGTNIQLWSSMMASQAIQSSALLVCIAFLIRRMVNALGTSRTALQQAEQSAAESQQQALMLANQTQQLEHAQTQLQALVDTLETPAVDIADGVILAPITGVVDVRRAHAITERLLHTVHQGRTRLVVLDLAGMPNADAEAIHALLVGVKSLQLLGCRVIFTSVAATLTMSFQNSKFDLQSLEFRHSPQEVLASDLFKRELKSA